MTIQYFCKELHAMIDNGLQLRSTWEKWEKDVLNFVNYCHFFWLGSYKGINLDSVHPFSHTIVGKSLFQLSIYHAISWLIWFYLLGVVGVDLTRSPVSNCREVLVVPLLGVVGPFQDFGPSSKRTTKIFSNPKSQNCPTCRFLVFFSLVYANYTEKNDIYILDLLDISTGRHDI